MRLKAKKIPNFIVTGLLVAMLHLKRCETAACTTNTTISVTTTGTFTSSGYPTAYSNNEHCGWYLQASAGNAVKIVMSVKTWGQGGGDFYSIYDGDGTTGNVLISNSFAENSKITIQSRGQNMFVYYLTNGGTTAQGFTVTYSPVAATGLTSGSVQNLNYGVSNYIASQQITWIINALSANRMLALFTPLSMDMYCANAIVRDGDLSTSPSLFDSSYVNRHYAYRSSGPAIQLFFDSGTCNTGTGVSMTFQEQSATDLPCTGTTVISGQTNGTLQIPTPNVGGFYNPGDSCSWQITVASGYSIGIKLTADAMPHWQFFSNNGDWISIRDGPNSQSRLIFMAWGGYAVSYITTTSNSAFITFTSDSDSLIGFPYTVAFMQIPKVQAFSGYIRTIGYPSSAYKTWEHSAWVLYASLGGTISFDISTIWLEIYDPVNFYDGPNVQSPQIAQVAAAGVYAWYNTTGRHLTILFDSDGLNEGNGWIVSFNETVPPCQSNQTLNVNSSTNVTFTSTNYPTKYSNYESCGWLVVADTGYAVEMTISTKSFDQGGGDWYAVYDGVDSNAPKFIQTMARQSKIGLTSRSNSMFLYFVSDDATVGEGFSVSCRQVPATGLASGFVQTLNLGISPYAVNELITWVVSALPTNFWLAFLTQLSLDMGCVNVNIKNGPLSNSPDLHISTYVNREYAFRTSGQYIQAKLLGGGCNGGTGFKLILQEQSSTTPSCSGVTVVNGLQNGTLQIPPANIAGFYNPNDNCSWLITVAAGYSIGIAMTAKIMPYSQNLGANPGDFIHVYDGADNTARLIFKAMGGYSTSYIATTSNNAFISFVADSDSLIGFPYTVTFTQIPKSTVFSGYIQNIGYPTVNYKTWEYSIWSVRTSPGQYIDVDINSVWLQIFDPVDFYEGTSLASPSIATVTCAACYSLYNTTNSALTIRFYSDGATEGPGWKVSFNESVPPCKINSTIYVNVTTNVTFTSTNYPIKYANFESCGWLVVADAGYAVEMTVSTMSFDQGGGDWYAIYDGTDSTAPLLISTKARQSKFSVTSRGRNSFFYFVSDGATVGQGFSVYCRQVPATGLTSGFASNLNYGISPYAANENIVWVFNALPGNKMLAGYFTDSLDMYCANGAVFNGPTTGSPALVGTSYVNREWYFQTSGQSVLMQFTSAACSGSRGIKMKFQERNNSVPVCSGITVVSGQVNGTLQVPTANVGGYYNPNDNCSWQISVAAGYSIGITMVSGGTPHWQYIGTAPGDYLSIYDGSSNQARLIFKSMGGYTKSYITTTSNVAFLNFAADSDSLVGLPYTVTFQQIPPTSAFNGYIKSVNYGVSNYRTWENSNWLVQTSKGKQIMFDIQSIWLQVFDPVTFYDGTSSTAYQIAQVICANCYQVLNTTNSSLYITFSSDGGTEGQGWKVTFNETGVTCYGTNNITVNATNNGTFTSSNYPSNYPDAESCGWFLETTSGHAIEVYFTVGSFQVNSGDSITIYDGGSKMGDVIFQSNGDYYHAKVRSRSNQMYVYFVSDASGNGQGFQAFYSQVNSTGVISGSFGKDSALQSESMYWSLFALPVNRLWIMADIFALSCSNMKVWDGESGQTLLYSDPYGNHGYGWLTTHNSSRIDSLAQACASANPNPLFEISFQETTSEPPRNTHTVISGNINGTVQLPAPNVVGGYSPSDNCSLKFTVSSSYSIGLTITSTYIDGPNDVLYIHDGSTESSNLILKTYASYAKIYITTTSNNVFLRFVANNDMKVGLGYTITYQQIALNGYITGYVQNLLYPTGKYRSNQNESWLINARPGNTIHHYMYALQLEGGDLVTTYDGSSTSAPIGEQVPINPYTQHYHTTGQTLYLTFWSSAGVEYSGFSMTFTETPSNYVSCSGVSYLDASINGTFSSNNYSYSTYYVPNQKCGWSIVGQPGYNLELTIISTYMGRYSDLIYVFDGPDDNSPLMLKTTSYHAKTVITSTAHFAYVLFVSDNNTLVGQGFTVSYRPLPQTGIARVGYLQPKNYPVSSYAIPDYTEWTLYAYPTAQILANLTTDMMNLWGNIDYVTIYDGASSSSLQSAHVDTSFINYAYQSNHSAFFVTWSTGVASNIGPGFRLVFSPAPAACTFNRTFYAGNVNSTFSSSNYPQNYFDNEACGWLLVASPGFEVEMILDAILIQQGDYVAVYDGPGSDRLVFQSASQVNFKLKIKSSSNQLFVYFYSDNTLGHTGFIATYYQVPATGFVSGYLQNLYYKVAAYGAPKNNSWLIGGSSGSRYWMLVELDSLNLYQDVLTIYDGPTFSDTQLWITASAPDKRAFVSSNSTCLVNFVVPTATTATGFRINFYEQRTPIVPCSGNTNVGGTSGTLTIPTPNPFGFYRPGDSCSWTVSVTSGYAISFTIIGDTMDPSGADGLSLYNETTSLIFTTIPEFGRVYFTSNSDTVKVVFDAGTDFRVGLSLQVSYQQVPNTGYMSGYSMTANYPGGTYYPGQDVWIRAICDNDHFVKFNATASVGTGDSVYFFDNAYGISPPIYQLTNGSMQSNTTRNVLWAQFLSDGGIQGTGFRTDFECSAMCPHRCLNGNCTGINNCTCAAGWTGLYCEIAICTNVQCQNGGNCTAPDTCTCTPQWSGTNCTIPVCSPKCGMGGNCTSPNNCTCIPGWNGTLCDNPICNNLCQNNGVCTLPDTCTCVVGYIGSVCETSTTNINTAAVLAMTDQMLVTNMATVQTSIDDLAKMSSSSNNVSAVVDVLAMTATLLSRYANIENMTAAQFIQITTTCAKAADTILIAATNVSALPNYMLLEDTVSIQCQEPVNPVAEPTSPPVFTEATSKDQRQQIFTQFTQMLANMVFGLNNVLPVGADMKFDGSFYSAIALHARLNDIPGKALSTSLANIEFPATDEPMKLFSTPPSQCSSLSRNSSVLVMLSAFVVNVNDVNLPFNMPTVTIRVYCQKEVELTLNQDYDVKVVAVPTIVRAIQYASSYNKAQCDISKIECNEDNKDRLGSLAAFSVLPNAGDYILVLPAIPYKYWVSIAFEWAPTVASYQWQFYVADNNISVSQNGSLGTLKFHNNQNVELRIIIPSDIIAEFAKASSNYSTLNVYTKKDFRTLDMSKVPASACDLQRVFGYHLRIGFASTNLGSRKRRSVSGSSDDFELMPESTESAVVFKSKYFGDFGADLVITPNTIEFSEVAANFAALVADNWAVLAFQVVAIVCFIVCVVFTFRYDRTDLREWAFLPILSNRRHERFKYLVSVQYSNIKNFDLGPKISVRLVGNVNETGWRLLEDGVRKNFQGKHPENFVLTSQVPIGRLDAIELRVRQREILHTIGKDRSVKMHVDRVVVVDQDRGLKYIFLSKATLSSGEAIKVELATEDELKDYTYLVSGHSKTSFTDIHPWLSVAKRPLPSNWTRCERLACVVSALFMAMMVNAMFYGKEAAAPSVGVKVGGFFTVSWFTVWTSFIGCCIVIPPTAIIAFVFKHVKRRSAEKSEWTTVFNVSVRPPSILVDNNDGNGDGSKDKVQKPFELPYYCVIAAWILVGACIGASAFIVIFYSLTWGQSKSLQWLSGMILTVIQDILLIQPIKVLLSAILSATIHNLPNDGLDLGTTKFNKNTDKYKIELFYRLRNILVGIFHHIIYVIIFAAVIGAMMNPYAYIQLASLKPQILIPKINQVTDTVVNHATIYDWLQGFLIPNFFTGNQIEYGGNYKTKFLYALNNPSISVLGPIRLRQQRLTPAPCALMGALTSPMYFKFRPLLAGPEVRCQKDYSNAFGLGDSSERQSYNGSWSIDRIISPESYDVNNVSMDFAPWIYRASDGAPYSGWEAAYQTGGYYVDLPRKKSAAVAFVANLRQARWLDNSTTVLFVDFNIFNVATNLFIPVRIVFESLNAGGMSYHVRMFPLQLYQYNGANSLLIYVVQALWVILLISHLVRIIRTIKKQGFKQFRADGWNWLDLTQILLGFGVIVVFAARIYFVVSTVTKIQTMRTTYINLDVLVSWEDIMFCMFGVEFFLTMLLFFRHLSINKHWAVLIATLSKGKMSLYSYGTVFILVTVFFAGIAYLVMGQSTWMFSSYYRSLMTLVEGVIGTVDFSSFSTHFYLFLTMLYNAVVIFFGGNIFVTIILAAHSEVTRDIEKQTTWDSDLSSYMTSGIKDLFSKKLSNTGRNVTYISGPKSAKSNELTKILDNAKSPTKQEACYEFENGIDRFSETIDRMITSEDDASSRRRQMQEFIWAAGMLSLASERKTMAKLAQQKAGAHKTVSLPTSDVKHQVARRMSSRGASPLVAPMPISYQENSSVKMPTVNTVRDYYMDAKTSKHIEPTPQLLPFERLDDEIKQVVHVKVTAKPNKPFPLPSVKTTTN